MLLFSHSVVSISFVILWTLVSWLLRPWGFPGKNTGVCCHFLLQGIFPTQGLSPSLLLGRGILCHWATQKALLVHNKHSVSACIIILPISILFPTESLLPWQVPGAAGRITYAWLWCWDSPYQPLLHRLRTSPGRSGGKPRGPGIAPPLLPTAAAAVTWLSAARLVRLGGSRPGGLQEMPFLCPLG